MRCIYIILTVLLAIKSFAQPCPPFGGNQSGGLGSGGDGSSSALNPVCTWSFPILRSSDPNELDGAIGYSAGKWISVNDQLQYTVHFENSPKSASGPAQNVYVHVPVHPRVNGYSLKLTGYGFGHYNFTVPNSSSYSNRLDLQDSLGLFVDITAGLDVVNNEVFWNFKSIDPVTGLAPQNAGSGFLPVNDTSLTDSMAGMGEGYVTFLLSPRSTLLTGDTVSAQAAIIFDQNNPLSTNIWTNTIDAFPPVSHVSFITSSNDTAILHWSGADDAGGTGIKSYNIYYSENGSPFTLYKNSVTDSLNSFMGTIGSTYSFFSVATDNVGNMEHLKDTGDASVTLTNVPPASVIDLPINGKHLSITAYPNPFSTFINLQVMNVVKSKNSQDIAQLYSLDGRLRFEQIIQADSNAIITLNNLPPLASGVYLLKVIIGNEQVTIKMVKQ